ncbi:MAG: hypothetical protein HRU24_13120 [Gammaproteobacteria bacterium]|nr:hypothetical protein [Gammaproteobacteria bacterium]
MTFKRYFSVGLSTLVIMGCSSTMVMRESIFKLNQDYRILRHDFSQKFDLMPADLLTPVSIIILDELEQVPAKKFTEVPTKVALEMEPPKKETTTVKITISDLQYIDVDFYNESAKIIDSKIIVEKILTELGSSSYMIVGHSHGKSNVGVEILSAQRARYISDALQLAGVPEKNIYHITSWSKTKDNYSISKGVRVFAMPKELTPNQLLITGILN